MLNNRKLHSQDYHANILSAQTWALWHCNNGCTGQLPRLNEITTSKECHTAKIFVLHTQHQLGKKLATYMLLFISLVSLILNSYNSVKCYSSESEF